MYVSRAMLVLGFVAVAGLLVQPSSVQADSLPPERWLIAKYDTNGDREISIDEIGEKRKKLFAFMDGDEDGQVSFAEYQHLDITKRQLLLQARFDKLDSNHDGKLSAAEYSSYLGSFDSFDRNGDGFISAEEMSGPAQPKSNDDDSYCLLWVCLRSSIH